MNSNDIDDAELLAQPETDESTEEAATSTESDFSMPEKFAGKSAEDIVKSYTELEKELGRKNNEVGELRKLTDQILQQQLSSTSGDPTEDSSVDFDTLVEKPGEVISEIVRKELESVNKRFDEIRSESRQDKFFRDNPDYEDISNSQEFYDWASASPTRQRILKDAMSGDFDAADAILADYRAAGEQIKANEQAAEKKRSKELADASVETAGTGASTNKVYSRAAILDLMVSNPAKYKAMLPEIEKAYEEGRITK